MNARLSKSTQPNLLSHSPGLARVALGAFALLAACIAPGAWAAGICYINPANPPTALQNGASWATAYRSLNSALGNIGGYQPSLTCGDRTEVWVAKGVHKPSPTDRTVSFKIPPGYQLYGGFDGTETSRDQRNPVANPTVLTGDLNGDDSTAQNGVDATVPADGSNADNSRHVVLMDGTTSAGPIDAGTILDGFTITGGNANGNTANWGDGGGLHCNGHGAGHKCNPTLSNLVFSGNSAYNAGGAMLNDGRGGGDSSPTLTNVTFNGNNADNQAGAMANFSENSGTSNPTLANVTFNDNSAMFGGAMLNLSVGGTSSPMLINVTFSGNSAWTEVSGAGGRGGAICNLAGGGGGANPTLQNVTFHANTAEAFGGAIGNFTDGGANDIAHPTLVNVILWSDTANIGGNELHNGIGGATTTSYSIVQGGCANGNGNDCSHVLTGDPKLGALADNGGFTKTMLPAPASAAIDTGTNTGCPSTDQRGKPRNDGHCDIGAVERQPNELDGICYVNIANSGPRDLFNNGTSWETAFSSLNQALGNTSGMHLPFKCGNRTEVWVAKGVYKPALTDRTVSFKIPPGFKLYGGFGGAESSRDERDPVANPTVLTGDLNHDDSTAQNGIDATVPTDGSNADNSYHVVLMDGTTSAGPIGYTDTVLDGFIITAGNADGDVEPNNSGGGLLCHGQPGGHACNPTLWHLIFSGNTAGIGGAIANGLYTSIGGVDANPSLSDILFRGNSAFFGGAIANVGKGGQSNPGIYDSTFVDNHALSGGAIYNTGDAGTSSPFLRNLTFHANRATNPNGGANGVGGAIFNDAQHGGTVKPELRNVTFNANTADNYGGAIYNFIGDTGSTTHTTLYTSILWGDQADGHGNEIYNATGATAKIVRSIMQNGCTAGDNNDCGTSVLTADPLLGDLADNGGFTPTMRPAAASPAIDAGLMAGCPYSDQRGVDRDDYGCDIGSVEVRQAQLWLEVGEHGSVTVGYDPNLVGPDPGACSNAACSPRYDIEEATPVLTLTAAPDANWHLAAWGGDCTDNGDGTASVTMDTLYKTCTATFAAGPFTVTPQATGPGSLAPDTPQSVSAGATTSFAVAPQPGAHLVNISGCDGTLNDDTYTTGPVAADCTVAATFAPDTHTVGGTVSGIVGSGLVLALEAAQTQSLPITTDGGFTFLEPLDSGTPYTVSVATQPTNPAQTCTIANASGTVGMADITSVEVTCVTQTHTVTATVASGQGTLTPATQSVADGNTATLTVSPDTGWHIDSVQGCGGTLTGDTYTTGAITGDCTVTATFATDRIFADGFDGT